MNMIRILDISVVFVIVEAKYYITSLKF